MAKYEGVKVMNIPVNMNRNYKIQKDISRVTIQFDATFDSRNFKLAIGLVGWDLRGELLVLKMIIHNNISSPFAAEAYAYLEGTKLGISLMRDSKIIKMPNDFNK
ncbi:hypothetical protein V6Z12_A10G213600 [Gossypium hirsutum]